MDNINYIEDNNGNGSIHVITMVILMLVIIILLISPNFLDDENSNTFAHRFLSTITIIGSLSFIIIMLSNNGITKSKITHGRDLFFSLILILFLVILNNYYENVKGNYSGILSFTILISFIYFLNKLYENYTGESSFLTQHISSISSLVIITITLITLFGFLNIDFNPPKNKINKIVSFENMKNKSDEENDLDDDEIIYNFCERDTKVDETDHHTHFHKKCNKLNETNCNLTSCCVLLNTDKGNVCTSGTEKGPTFRGNPNNKNHKYNINYYYYKDDCYNFSKDKKCPKKK